VNELRGKGWCVLGYFLWMLGAGMLLDHGPWWTGRILCATGAVLFAVGWLQLRGAPEQRPGAAEHEDDIAVPHTGEGYGRTP